MGKRRKKKAELKPEAKVEDEAKAQLEADHKSGELEVENEMLPDVSEATQEPIAKPSVVQCANCEKLVPRNELFHCHHCGKHGCSECGWYPPKNNVCPNCGTTVRVLRGTR